MKTPATDPSLPLVHIVSHGPYCLDGVTAAVAVARYYRNRATIIPHFSGNDQINNVLCSIHRGDAPPGSELWITDISWTEKMTDDHLRDLAKHGVKIYWIDHHRTAIRRFATGTIAVPFTDKVISEEFAASRLTYEYLQQKGDPTNLPNTPFVEFAPVVAMADDTDRWIHAIPGSRELAWVIRALGTDGSSLDGYQALLNIDAAVTYTPTMQRAYDKVAGEMQASFDLAERSRTTLQVTGTPYTLVTAVCDGYPSEIGDAWGKVSTQTVFAFFDLKGEGVSLRRSPDCQADLSQLAQTFGGGGHPAAAGCRPKELPRLFAEATARLLTTGFSVVTPSDPTTTS